jgi:predicted membrane channel-forming protein YqfA (hemolysin III family)
VKANLDHLTITNIIVVTLTFLIFLFLLGWSVTWKIMLTILVVSVVFAVAAARSSAPADTGFGGY